MSAAVQPLYAIQGPTADPFGVPAPPFRFVEMRDRIDTYIVLSGSVRLGTVRHDAGSGLFVAKTNGCPNGSAAADIQRNLATREKAAEWLARAIDGIQPRRPYGSRRSKTLLAAAALVGLALGRPALAADGRPSLPDPPAINLVPWVSPPPTGVLSAVVALRLYCPLWRERDGAAGFESEAHVYAVLAGHDPAYANGATAASLMTAAVLGGIWLLLRLPAWLASILAPVRRLRDLDPEREALPTSTPVWETVQK